MLGHTHGDAIHLRLIRQCVVLIQDHRRHLCCVSDGVVKLRISDQIGEQFIKGVDNRDDLPDKGDFCFLYFVRC